LLLHLALALLLLLLREAPGLVLRLVQVTKWPAMEKWSRQYLEAAFEGSHVLVGDQPISFQAYCKYADTNRDELPLYL
jgi:hypothetical protein